MGIPRQQDCGRDRPAEGGRQAAWPPYRHGDRLPAVDPDTGIHYLLRVERIVPAAEDEYRLVAAVVWPRRLRSQLVTLTVDAAGAGPGISRPAI